MNKFYLVIIGLLLLAACVNQPATPVITPAIAPTQMLPTAITPLISTQPTAAATQENAPSATIITSPESGSPTISFLEVNSSFTPLAIQMVDAEQGWSIAKDERQDTHILRTHDGARTWQDVTPQEPASTAQQNGKHLLPFFLDSQNAWAVYWTIDTDAGPVFNPTVWYTTDGGQNWNSSTELDTSAWEGGYATPAYLTFTDPKNGFLDLAHDPGAGHAPLSIFRTQDGGVNWSIVKEPMDEGDDYLDACCQTGLAFIDPMIGVVTKDPGPVSRTYLDWTNDGGVTWLDQEPPPADQELYDSGMCGTFAPDANQPGTLRIVVSCIQDAVPSSPPTAFLYTTSDAGKSWIFDRLPDLPWDQAAWPYLRRTDKTQFLSPQEGWLFTIANYENPDQSTQLIRTFLYHTSDGGTSWNSPGDFAGTGQFSFIDPQNGWAVLQDGEITTLQHTSDGGKTWETLPTITALSAAQRATLYSIYALR
jgi:photosystem II stability/assembly factor-like uncharacterized protein